MGEIDRIDIDAAILVAALRMKASGVPPSSDAGLRVLADIRRLLPSCVEMAFNSVLADIEPREARGALAFAAGAAAAGRVAAENEISRFEAAARSN